MKQKPTASKGTAKSPRRRGRTKAATYHHGTLRRALIASARELLEAEGYEALTLRGAARRAGVSQAAPYHHFADKLALLAAVSTIGFQEFAASMHARMALAAGPKARLTAAAIAYVGFATANPALFKMMFGAAGNRLAADAALAAARDAAYDILQNAVSDVLEPGRKAVDAVLLNSLGIWAAVHGLSTLLNEGGVSPSVYGVNSAEALTALLLERGGASIQPY